MIVGEHITECLQIGSPSAKVFRYKQGKDTTKVDYLGSVYEDASPEFMSEQVTMVQSEDDNIVACLNVLARQLDCIRAQAANDARVELPDEEGDSQLIPLCFVLLWEKY